MLVRRFRLAAIPRVGRLRTGMFLVAEQRLPVFRQAKTVAAQLQVKPVFQVSRRLHRLVW